MAFDTATDPGLTRMGCEVVAEMNRVGLVVDRSHSADRSTIEATEQSSRPIAITTHANPHLWRPARRDKRAEVIEAVIAWGVGPAVRAGRARGPPTPIEAAHRGAGP